MFLSSYTNTSGSLGEREMLWEHEPQATLRAESPSIFLDKSGRGRRLCERLQDSLIQRSSEKMDESVQFPVGQTGFSSKLPVIIVVSFPESARSYRFNHTRLPKKKKKTLKVTKFTSCTVNFRMIQAMIKCFERSTVAEN